MSMPDRIIIRAYESMTILIEVVVIVSAVVLPILAMNLIIGTL